MRAHKLFFSRSDYFKAMFTAGMMEMQSEHVPINTTFDIFRAGTLLTTAQCVSHGIFVH